VIVGGGGSSSNCSGMCS
nr:hypothetical protein [Tanacetum cinerariifolium]